MWRARTRDYVYSVDLSRGICGVVNALVCSTVLSSAVLLAARTYRYTYRVWHGEMHFIWL
jgi:hypothetical protein